MSHSVYIDIGNTHAIINLSVAICRSLPSYIVATSGTNILVPMLITQPYFVIYNNALLLYFILLNISFSLKITMNYEHCLLLVVTQAGTNVLKHRTNIFPNILYRRLNFYQSTLCHFPETDDNINYRGNLISRISTFVCKSYA